MAPVIDAFAEADLRPRPARRGIHDSDRGLPGRRRAGRPRGRRRDPRPRPHGPTPTTGDRRPRPTDCRVDRATEADRRSDELADLVKVRPDQVRWNVSILIDGIALKRGYATATETCEIVGVGPVDVDFVKRILPEALVDVLVHDLVDIQAYATTTRYRKRALDKALQARDRRCVVPGCKRKRRLQADHRHDFPKGGPTSGHEPRAAVRRAPRREDPSRRGHRTHRHRMALVPARPQARRTRTATRVDPVAEPDR